MAWRSMGALPIVTLVVLALVAPVAASTVAPPVHLGELARSSRAVVLARAVASWDDDAPGLPSTATRFERLEQVAGEPLADTFVVSEPGGARGGVGLAVGGAPRYAKGRTYLLFLDKIGEGRFRSRMLAYGLLVEDEATGLMVPLPEVAGIETVGERHEPVTAYDRARLLEHLAEVAGGREWNRERAGGTPVPAALVPPPPECQFLRYSDGFPIRWFGYEVGAGPVGMFHTTPGQAGIADGGISSIQQGVAAWTNHASSIIRYAYAGSIPATVNCTNGAQDSATWFNDPCADIPDLSGCAGTLAFGGGFFQIATTPHDGDPWHAIVAPFVVVNNGSQCIGAVSFAEMMTHELGHTQGFGHHAVAAAPNNPTMSAVLKGDGRGAALVGADRTCASYAYHTFLDVPLNHFAWRFVEAVENAGVTGGCQTGFFCPDGVVTRDQMAVFLLLAREGPAYNPPACTTPPFNDVPVSSPFCRWIRELAARGVTAGCGGGNYCPASVVTRDQMAVFLLKTREGVAYNPPPCTAPMFNDVPCSNPFSPWINELVRRGITSGCGGGNYCPTQPNSRAQMAIFLTTTFGLPLP